MAHLILLFIATMVSQLLDQVKPHGAMVYPITWFQKPHWRYDHQAKQWKFDNYLGMDSKHMCSGGYWIDKNKLCPGGKPGQPKGCGAGNNPGIACFWFNDRKYIPDDACVTIHDKNLRTYEINQPYPWRHRHPWRAPGTAPVDSPCGVGGGNLNGCNGKRCPQGAYAYGPKAEEFDFTTTDKHWPHPIKPKVTNWKRGSVVEAAWGITANHGGGYIYRICKVPSEGIRGVTEVCFQNGSLEFVGTKQWIQYGKNPSTRVEIPATRVSQGTYPKDSVWTKNPVAACKGVKGDGGFQDPQPSCPNGSQFTPSRPDLKGYGTSLDGSDRRFSFSIVDKLRVPSNIPTGRYVLSWRWDSEETPQVWNTCASIQIN